MKGHLRITCLPFVRARWVHLCVKEQKQEQHPKVAIPKSNLPFDYCNTMHKSYSSKHSVSYFYSPFLFT